MTPSEMNILVGLQWGGEGREDLDRFLTETSDVTVRFQGCANGLFSNKRHYSSEVPGNDAFADKYQRLICRGVFLDLELIAEEIKLTEIESQQRPRLTISKACPIIFDFHRKIDTLSSAAFSQETSSDTLQRGAVSAACDRYLRIGVTSGDLLSPDILRQKISRNLEMKNSILSRVFGAAEFDPDYSCETYLKLAEILTPYIGDAESMLADAIKSNLRIFFEGVGGTMQDTSEESHFDTAPFPTLASAVLSGADIKLPFYSRIIGAAKAYLTRSAGGGLISAEKSSVASFIRSRGGEDGESTVGWLDLPALKYALGKNGADALVMTKLDVLTGIDEVKICIGYKVGQAERFRFDLTAEEMTRAEPIYKTFGGWRGDLSPYDSLRGFPVEALAFMRYVENEVKVPVLWTGVGSARLGDINNLH